MGVSGFLILLSDCFWILSVVKIKRRGEKRCEKEGFGGMGGDSGL